MMKKDNTSKKKRKNRKKAEQTKKITQSTTDPESGLCEKKNIKVYCTDTDDTITLQSDGFVYTIE